MSRKECPPCNGNCNQGRDCPILLGDLEERPIPGAGLVNAIGIMAIAVALVCILRGLWDAFA